MTEDAEAILTLEPLIEAVRLGIEGAGWELSGLQKTTSHQFEGRWAGDSTRSAYLFFHPADDDRGVSVDVYLDETSRGLRGNLALVLDGPDLGGLGSAADVLQSLSAVGTRVLPSGYRRPLSLRFRLESVGDAPGEAETEIRFKIAIPAPSFEEGRNAVAEVAERAVRSFEGLLEAPEIDHLIL